MPSGPVTVSMVGMILIVAGTGAYALWRFDGTTPIVGVVRTTEIRVAPEVGGQLVAIKVHKGEPVRAGDVVADLAALELSASVEQAQAVLAAAAADRDHVYAGPRAEQVASLAGAIAKAKSRLAYAQQQFTRASQLARNDVASQQSLDQAENDVATARADVAEAEANHGAAVHRAPSLTSCWSASAARQMTSREDQRLSQTVMPGWKPLASPCGSRGSRSVLRS